MGVCHGVGASAFIFGRNRGQGNAELYSGSLFEQNGELKRMSETPRT